MKVYCGIDTKEKIVALTFDDGPNPVFTPLILDTLKNMNVKATFFLLGKRAREFPGIALRVRDEGHCIGSHTYYHEEDRPQGVSNKEDFDEGKKAIDELLEMNCYFFKPPSYHIDNYRGFLPDNTKAIMYTKNCGRGIDTEDYGYKVLSDPKSIMDEILQKVTRPPPLQGSLIHFHDGCERDSEPYWVYRATPTHLLLPELILELKRNGYTFVKLDGYEVKLLEHGCQTNPKLIIITGLPGSGKTNLMQGLIGEGKVLQDCAYDDFHANADGDSTEAVNSKYFCSLIDNLRFGKDCAVSDVAFCEEPRRSSLIAAVKLRIPAVEADLRFFENEPEICIQNVRRRPRVSVEQEINLIDQYRGLYTIPDGVTPIKVYREIGS